MRILTIVLLLTIFGCKDKYQVREISGVTIKIDKQINERLQDRLFEQIEIQVAKGGLLDSVELTELKFDSTFFSYLLSVNSNDSVSLSDLAYLKGFGTILSNDLLNKTPVHYYSDYNNRYYKHDTSTIIFTNDLHREDNKLKLSSHGISMDKADAIAKLILIATRDLELQEKLIADIKSDSSRYSIDFILNKDIENAHKLKESFTKIDPALIFLVFGSDHILIKFKDNGNHEFMNGLYIQ